MSEDGATPSPTQHHRPDGLEQPVNYIERYTLAQRSAGLIAPVITAVIAFLLGGIVILISTGKAPWGVYSEIFKGAGLSWFFEVGNYHVGLPFSDATVWFPWNVNDGESLAASNLQQTLITTTTLILTGLAVAFAFRCGLFNIGGQGQYLSGAILAVIIGSNLDGMSPFLHITLAVVLGVLAGALLAGIAGYLKATVGTHEVITTIMLNWVVIWVGVFLFTLGGPLQNTSTGSPISHDVVEGAKLPVFWGDPLLQGLHVGFFVALLALVAYWAILNRTTLGYSVRAVGFNPEAARYGGINVSRNYFLAMAISGRVRRSRRRHRHPRLAVPAMSQGDIRTSTIAFVGIAVALLGRNTAIGVVLAALLFGALYDGHVDEQPRSVDLRAGARVEPHPVDPGTRRALRRRGRDRAVASRARVVGRRRHEPRVVSAGRASSSACSPGSSACRRSRHGHPWSRSSSVSSRSGSASTSSCVVRSVSVGTRCRRRLRPCPRLDVDPVEHRRTWGTSSSGRRCSRRCSDSRLHSVRVDRRHVQGALGGHEHRARGDDADRCVLRDPGAPTSPGLVGARARRRDCRRRLDGAPPRVLLDPPPCRSDRQRNRDQLPCRSGSRGTCSSTSTGRRERRATSRWFPTSISVCSTTCRSSATSSGRST